jgi:hypothetical protein
VVPSHLLPALSQWHIFGIVFVLMPQLALGTFSEIMAKQSAVYAASIGKANVDDNTPPLIDLSIHHFGNFYFQN